MGVIDVHGDGSLSDSSVLSITLGGQLTEIEQFLSADGRFELKGELSVTMDGPIGSFPTFTIVEADELVGGFDNIVPRQRTLTTDGKFSFLMTSTSKPSR
jgi:hypothetical protein